jgi:hypothetical protein
MLWTLHNWRDHQAGGALCKEAYHNRSTRVCQTFPQSWHRSTFLWERKSFGSTGDRQCLSAFQIRRKHGLGLCREHRGISRLCSTKSESIRVLLNAVCQSHRQNLCLFEAESLWSLQRNLRPLLLQLSNAPTIAVSTLGQDHAELLLLCLNASQLPSSRAYHQLVISNVIGLTHFLLD